MTEARAPTPSRTGSSTPTRPCCPAFPGWHGVRDALAAGVAETGCTVHLATLEMDAGPILAQEVVPVLPGDTEATLHERIKVVERTLYPGHRGLGPGGAGGRADDRGHPAGWRGSAVAAGLQAAWTPTESQDKEQTRR